MFDGPDGVGKTEQIKNAEAALSNQHFPVYVTRVHGGTPIGERLREVSFSNIPRSPATDLYISKTMHIELASDLKIRRDAGAICLVDRSPAAMWSYQVRGGGLSKDFALPIIRDSFAMFEADLVIIYMAPLQKLRKRIQKRDGASDYFESKPEAYHERVIAGYAEASQIFGTELVDAGGSVESMHQTTMELISKLLVTQD